MKLKNNYGMSVNMFYKPNRGIGQGVLFLLKGLCCNELVYQERDFIKLIILFLVLILSS